MTFYSIKKQKQNKTKFKYTKKKWPATNQFLKTKKKNPINWRTETNNMSLGPVIKRKSNSNNLKQNPGEDIHAKVVLWIPGKLQSSFFH